LRLLVDFGKGCFEDLPFYLSVIGEQQKDVAHPTWLRLLLSGYQIVCPTFNLKITSIKRRIAVMMFGVCKINSSLAPFSSKGKN